MPRGTTAISPGPTASGASPVRSSTEPGARTNSSSPAPPVDPGPTADPPRLGEGGSAELLRVQAERRALRRVAARGQRPLDGLAGELVPESRLVGVLPQPLLRVLRADRHVGHHSLLARLPHCNHVTPLPPGGLPARRDKRPATAAWGRL